MIVDSHAHLDFLEPDELAAALAAAAEDDLHVITVGMDLDRSRRGADLAAASSVIHAAVGIHPWCAAEAGPLEPVLRALRDLAGRPGIVAIGEVGLDHVDNLALGISYDDPGARRIQRECFAAQVALAADLGLPLIIHARGAHDAVIDVLAAHAGCRGAIQLIEGTPRDVARYAELGFALALGSRAALDASAAWRETVRAVPDDLLLLETDAPWSPLAGRARSAPADLPEIAAAVAAVRGAPPLDVLRRSADTAARIFGLTAG